MKSSAIKATVASPGGSGLGGFGGGAGGSSSLGMPPTSGTPNERHVQKYHHDWEKEKDDYLMKDIRDLLADPSPSQTQNHHSVTNHQNRKRAAQGPHTPLVDSSILIEQTPPASAQPSRYPKQQDTGQHHYLKPPVLPLLVHGPSQGSIRHGRGGDTSPQGFISTQPGGMPPGQGSTINTTIMRHTSSTGTMWGKNGNRSPANTQKNADLRQAGLPSTRKDPDLMQIVELNESAQEKLQKKTQEEFLFQYIQQFQDAMASKEQYRREQAQVQQRRSRRNGNSVNLTATSQQVGVNGSVFQNFSSQLPYQAESTMEASKNSPKSQQRRQSKPKEPQIERHWYGVTLKVDDKSGFKGHKHVIDKYPATGTDLNVQKSQVQQQKMLTEDSLLQRSIPQNSQDQLDSNHSKVEDSLFRGAHESLPINPMLEVEEECSRIEHTAHTDELNMNSFDNRDVARDSVDFQQSSEVGLPKIAPESITILQDEQIQYNQRGDRATNLPQISSPPAMTSNFSPNLKFMTHANGFHRGAPRQINKYHRRNATGGVAKGVSPIKAEDTPSGGDGGGPQLLTRRKSNFIQVENQLQQQLQIIEDQQLHSSLRYPNKASTNRQAFISKNLNVLQQNPHASRVTGYSSGLNRILRQSLHQENSVERQVLSGGAIINQSMQDPLLFDESQIQSAQMSLSMKSNFMHSNKARGLGMPQQRASINQQDDLLQMMSESIQEPLTRNDLTIEEEQSSLLQASSQLPSLNSKTQRSIFKQIVKEPQRLSLPSKNILKQSILATEPRVAKAKYLAGTTQVSPVRKSHAKQYYQQFIPQTILNYQVSQDPVSAGDGAFSDNEYGPDQEILASAGMVSSGGFIGDQHHQRKARKSQRAEEVMHAKIATPPSNHILLSSDGFEQNKRIQSQIANKVVVSHHEQRKPSTGVLKSIGQFGHAHSEWRKVLKSKPVPEANTAMSSSFDRSNPLKATNFDSNKLGSDHQTHLDGTTSSFFKSGKASKLQPLSNSSNKKLLGSPNPQEKNLINLHKVTVTSHPQPLPAANKPTINKQSLFKEDQIASTGNQAGASKQASQVAKKPLANSFKSSNKGSQQDQVQQQPPVKVLEPIQDFKNKYRNGFGQIIGGVPQQGKRNMNLLNQSSIDSELQELARGDSTSQEEKVEKEKSVLNTTSKSIKFGLDTKKAQTSQSSFRASQSPVVRPVGVSRAAANQSPQRTQTKLSINKHQRSITQEPHQPIPAEGQILDFDVEHLLHPLRSICGSKKLCSCSKHAVKYVPKQKSPSPDRLQKELPKEDSKVKDSKAKVSEPPLPQKGDPQSKDDMASKESLPAEKASLEAIQKQETAEVASMLEKVELKDTPAFNQHFNHDKVTEAESLKGTNIGIRRYQEQAKNKGRSMGQIALDLKDEKLRRQLLDKALKNYYMEPELQYLIKITKNRNLNDHQMLVVYEKAVDTLEVLMIKLGLDDPYQKVVVHYESLKTNHLRPLLIKVLTRCMVMYESLGKMEIIFKLMRKRAEMEERFRDFEKNWMTGQKFKSSNADQAQQIYQQKLQSLEQDVAQYCYQSCRLWVQISAFTFDHSIMNEFKFKFGGPEYQPLIRKQVDQARLKFAPLFGWEKIPLLNEDGRLYYDASEGAPTEVVRVGGGFTTSKGPIGAGAGIVRQGSSLSNSSKNRLNSQSGMRQQSLSPMRSSSKLL